MDRRRRLIRPSRSGCGGREAAEAVRCCRRLFDGATEGVTYGGLDI